MRRHGCASKLHLPRVIVLLYNEQEADEMEQLVAEAGRSLGFERLKPQQMSAVLKFMEGNDVFVALPIGFGKSAIFGILPRAFDLKLNRTISIVLVVSPLTALVMGMEKFVPRGMDAEFLAEIQEDTDAISRPWSSCSTRLRRKPRYTIYRRLRCRTMPFHTIV